MYIPHHSYTRLARIDAIRSCARRVMAVAAVLLAGAAQAAEPGRDHGRGSKDAPRLIQQEAIVVGTTQALRFSPSRGLLEATEVISSPGAQSGGQGAVAGSCSGTEVVSLTDASFEGGPLTLQLGFAEDEIFAAEYNIPADHFPITIRQINFVLAQSTTVATLTHYTLFIWEGEPGGTTNSIEIARFNSMEDLLPVEMPAGLQGTNVQITIDGADTDQIIIDNLLELNKFSIGIRIDQHNNPPFDPCLPLGDTETTNAFPTTDVSGLDFPNENWIFALDCLAGLCPSGWTELGNLGICQPSGDWIMKATYECSFELAIGACCTSDGECLEQIANTLCAQLGEGAEFFEGQLCADVECPDPTGGCCAFGTCLTGQTQADCDGFAGSYLGDGSNCDNSPCTAGACCMEDGSCEEILEQSCVDAGGTFEGAGVLCSETSCPQPLGACCFGNICVPDQLEANCTVSGEWLGPLSTCDNEPCDLDPCPDTPLLNVMPGSGTTDARQPSSTTDTTLAEGIGSASEPIIIDLGVTGAEACFSFCESLVDPEAGANAIGSVVDTGSGVYEITLLHAITPGAHTTITYDGNGSVVEYVSHPGNINDDAFADAADITDLADVLDMLLTPPHGLASSDLDRDGTVGPEDLLRLIDLLNGGGTLDPWFDTPRPDDSICP
ncbi:MAG: hypothetical protein ACYTHJ_17335 [Planctomycetota bacterium]